MQFLPNLKEFHFTGNISLNGQEMTDHDFKQLKKLPQLKVISLEYTLPSANQLEILKRSNVERIISPDGELKLRIKTNSSGSKQKIWVKVKR